ncbi:orotidine-5'-phosphate decarboxylase [Cytobacillus sp. IB215665]|uniref:orotidine-5'-phosphate decarboxylase n=1 Tax=Cytobacillus sp. IB215665 TaxID=3097357 RepID=UPI002A0AB59E|nr:orotidine-5'-phosphate decarboxylase [Cytobacillus sp. IB215665]MDX8365002.1 orotidine-5'-phosphate decarboxylase [Cytobacillus sp. IB215665]
MKRPLIIALDFAEQEQVNQFLANFHGENLYLKVGMELFYQEGPQIVSQLKNAGHNIFLDLKLHDIPNTVMSAMKGIARLGVDIINVHAAGGKQMMEAAMEGLEAGTPSGNNRPSCIAVTQLTSTSQQMLSEQLLIDHSLDNVVLQYANNAKQSGLDGIVCSTLEVPTIQKELGKAFATVTPGIRQLTDNQDDQVRIATPEKARQLGSTAIVVGRSITKAQDPVAAYKKMKAEWEGVSI